MYEQKNPNYLPEKQTAEHPPAERTLNVVCVQWENVELETLQDTGDQQR